MKLEFAVVVAVLAAGGIGGLGPARAADAGNPAERPSVIAWPAPEGVEPSPDYGLEVNGRPVFVWPARVREEIDKPSGSIWTHKPGCPAERAAFALFDFEGGVQVEVRPRRAFRTATVHPLSAGVRPEIRDGAIRFRMDRPRPLTIMLDGSDETPLHLLADLPEKVVPQAGDPGVVYFGPGIHDVETIDLKSGQTLYLAGGALLRAKVPAGAKWIRSKRTGLAHCDAGPVIRVHGVEDVRIRGRGVVDGELIPHPARSLLVVHKSKNVSIEGVMLRNSPAWNITLNDSDDIRVEGVKLISGRLNSDGINSVNARDVTIRRCFVRNHDDSIVVKTTSPEGEAARITAEQCVIWNDWGYALGVTYETRAPIHDLVFRDCDVIFVRHHALGIHVVDSATIRNVVFDRVRVEDLALPAKRFGHPAKLIRVAVAADMWGTDNERGQIRDVVFRNIRLEGTLAARSEILGFDATHGVERVTLENVSFLGRSVSTPQEMNLTVNDFAREVSIQNESPGKR